MGVVLVVVVAAVADATLDRDAPPRLNRRRRVDGVLLEASLKTLLMMLLLLPPPPKESRLELIVNQSTETG
jgi:hypothetical protein